MIHACRSVRLSTALMLAGAVLADGLDAQQRRHAPASGPLPEVEEFFDPSSLVSIGPGTVLADQRISNDAGGFPDTLDTLDEFGISMAALGDLDGDGVGDLAVGAQRDDDGGTDRGAVWVLFLASDGSVASSRKISSTNGNFTGALDNGDFFGGSVTNLGDLDGDGVTDLAVGAPRDDDGGPSRGAVWVLFLETDGSVKAQQKISDTQGSFTGVLDNDDEFGAAVTGLGDLDGDGVLDLAVGAPEDDDGSPGDGGFGSGAVWVLFLAGDGTVQAHQKISATQGGFTGSHDIDDVFGSAVAALGDLDGDGISDLAVGAPGTDDDGEASGAVWILFLDLDGTVEAHQKIRGSGLAAADRFGSSLAFLGDHDGDGVGDLAVGTPGDDDGGAFDDKGAVFVEFLHANGTIKDEQKISSTQGGFGGPLNVQDFFGSSVASPGDLDGDGTADLVVGAARDDDGGSAHGAVWVLFLEANATVDSEAKISDRPGSFEGTLDDLDAFGGSVAALGDLDGDGIGDLAVGASDPDVISGGLIWMLFLHADGTVKAHRRISATEGGFGGPTNTLFGSALAALGDFDGDGIGDLAAGARGDDQGGTDSGALWFLFLAADGSVQSEQKIGETQGGFAGSLDFGDQFGGAVCTLGDLDGNGVGDLAVGARQDDDGGTNRGAVWILFMNANGTVESERKISDTQGGFGGALDDQDFFGSAVASVGDLDGDGVRDLAVGATGDDDAQILGGGFDRGAVWILFMNPDGTVASERKISDTESDFGGQMTNQDAMGNSLAFLGDIDCDGVGDLAVGAHLDDDAGANRGAVWVLFLQTDGDVKTEAKISDTQGGFAGPLGNNDHFGSALAAADRDGDGLRDLVVGAPLAEDGGPDHGAVWLVALDGLATIGFDSADGPPHLALANGQDLSSPGELGHTLALASSGANLGAALFDSTPLGPNDPSQDSDLLVDLGNLLILQNDQNAQVSQQTVPGFFDRPNDDQDGGTFVLTFVHGPVAPLSVDLVDIDFDAGVPQFAIVTLFDASGRLRSYSVPGGWTEDITDQGPPGYRTLDLTTLAPQPGFFGSASAAESPGFDPFAVTRIEVQLGSSGALDNLCWDPHPD